MMSEFIQNMEDFVKRQLSYASDYVVVGIINSNIPNWHLAIQSQQRKRQNNVWNMFKVNYSETRTSWITQYQRLYH